MTKQELLAYIADMPDDESVNFFHLAAMDGYYILEAFTRENLEHLGYDLTNVEDETLYTMALKTELDLDNIAALCEYYEIPEKKQQEGGAMITKQELLAFVADIPDEKFSGDYQVMFEPNLAEILYNTCSEGRVIFGMNRDTIADLGYDVRGVDKATLNDIADTLCDALDIQETLIEILDNMHIPKDEDD